jgi:hypothetical protein
MPLVANMTRTPRVLQFPPAEDGRRIRARVLLRQGVPEEVSEAELASVREKPVVRAWFEAGVLAEVERELTDASGEEGSGGDLAGVVGDDLIEKLALIGITTREQLAAADVESLTVIEGVGPARATTFIEAAQAALGDEG